MLWSPSQTRPKTIISQALIPNRIETIDRKWKLRRTENETFYERMLKHDHIKKIIKLRFNSSH